MVQRLTHILALIAFVLFTMPSFAVDMNGMDRMAEEHACYDAHQVHTANDFDEDSSKLRKILFFVFQNYPPIFLLFFKFILILQKYKNFYRFRMF